MAKTGKNKTLRPPLTPEAQESQMISLAMDVAKQRLLDGTASSQLVVHFLKLGSEQAKTEREILELQKELVKAKTESLKDSKDMKKLYANAIKAMKRYSGNGDADGEDYDSDVFGDDPVTDF